MKRGSKTAQEERGGQDGLKAGKNRKNSFSMLA